MQFFWTIRSMGGPLAITDGEGKEHYHARTVPDIGERLALLAADGGGQLAAIVRGVADLCAPDFSVPYGRAA